MKARLQVASAAICRGHCTSWCSKKTRWMINIAMLAMLAMLEWGIPAYHIFEATQFLVRSIPRFWWLKWLKCPFVRISFWGKEFHGSFLSHRSTRHPRSLLPATLFHTWKMLEAELWSQELWPNFVNVQDIIEHTRPGKRSHNELENHHV